MEYQSAASTESSAKRKCGICTEEVATRKLISCPHSVCLGCLKCILQIQQTTGTLPCPICRITMDIPPGGLEDENGLEDPQDPGCCQFKLQSLSSVAESADDYSEQLSVDRQEHIPHGYESFQLAWEKCRKNVADDMWTERSPSPARLSDASETKQISTKRNLDKRYCRTHSDEKVRFFCVRCSTVICRDCKLTAHEGHPSTDLSTKSLEARSTILQVILRARTNLERYLLQALEQVQCQKKRVEQRKKSIEEELQHRAERLKSEIDNCLAEALQKLNHQTENIDNIVSHCIDDLTNELLCVRSLREQAENLMQSQCDVDILDMVSQMKEYFDVSDAHEYELVTDEYNMLGNLRSPLEGKLALFLNNAWNVNVRLIDGVPIQLGKGCQFCLDLNKDSCPSCQSDRANAVAKIPDSPPDGRANKPIRKLFRLKQMKGTLHPSPDRCEPRPLQSAQKSALAIIQTTIPRYMGHVTRSHSTKPLHKQSRKDSTQTVSGALCTELCAVRSLLASWKSTSSC